MPTIAGVVSGAVKSVQAMATVMAGGGPLGSLCLTDLLGVGMVFLPESLIVDGQPSTLSPVAGVPLASLGIGQTAAVIFKATVTQIPPGGMISNRASATFSHSSCNVPLGTAVSNTVVTTVAINVSGWVYSQQISDIIHSIALEEAAIAGIAGAEGAKIQRMLALGATPNELLGVNKSVSDMLEALGTLESVLKQKLSTVNCQTPPVCPDPHV